MRIVDDLSFELFSGERTAIIGESGCGKSMAAMAVFRLLPENCYSSGRVIFDNEVDLMSLHEKSTNKLRGKEMVYIPQGAMNHLNPVLKVGYQMEEVLKKCGSRDRKTNRDKILRLLSSVGFDEPERIISMYSHELSGGMAQKVMIAVGMAGKPLLVLADEPTRGLDESAKEDYINLLKQTYFEAALLIITHDMEVAAQCQNIIVMYAGEIVEAGAAETVLSVPLHPYTKGLLRSLPSHGMHPIPGMHPSLSNPPSGCRFHSRCQDAKERCRREHPPIQECKGAVGRCFFA